MEVSFKFEIGDLVVQKQAMEAWRVEQQMHPDLRGMPIVLMVLQRQFEECPGGVQYHYTLSSWKSAGSPNTKFVANEIELEKYDGVRLIQIYRTLAAGAEEKSPA